MRLETERLILRPPVTSDADAYCNICNSVFVLRYNAMTPKSKEAIADHFLGTCDDTWIIEEKKSGKLVGAIFTEDDSIRWDVESIELSYFLGEEYSRRGYMKEAMHALIDYLFTTKPLACVAARSFAPNTASRKLLESLGFHCDGYIPMCVKGYKDTIFDDTLYSVFKENWK